VTAFTFNAGKYIKKRLCLAKHHDMVYGGNVGTNTCICNLIISGYTYYVCSGLYYMLFFPLLCVKSTHYGGDFIIEVSVDEPEEKKLLLRQTYI
jgi:hypothetical protein